MSRCPTKYELDIMSAADRHFALERHAQEIAAERDGLLSGFITPSDGKTKIGLFESCRRRLAHVIAVADGYDITLELPLEGEQAGFIPAV